MLPLGRTHLQVKQPVLTRFGLPSPSLPSALAASTLASVRGPTRLTFFTGLTPAGPGAVFLFWLAAGMGCGGTRPKAGSREEAGEMELLWYVKAGCRYADWSSMVASFELRARWPGTSAWSRTTTTTTTTTRVKVGYCCEGGEEQTGRSRRRETEKGRRHDRPSILGASNAVQASTSNVLRIAFVPDSTSVRSRWLAIMHQGHDVKVDQGGPVHVVVGLES